MSADFTPGDRVRQGRHAGIVVGTETRYRVRFDGGGEGTVDATTLTYDGRCLPTPESTRLEVCARALHEYTEPRRVKRMRAGGLYGVEPMAYDDIDESCRQEYRDVAGVVLRASGDVDAE